MNFFKSVFTSLACCGSVLAADWYVATNGNDGAAGTIGAPFASITNAVEQMSPGDTCFIRGGRYHEEVVISHKDNLTFKAYGDETVVMDGTAAITESWSVHAGNIYKTTLARDIWQLFVDEEIMVMARWPNAFFHDGSVWDQVGTWALGDDNLSANGWCVDTANNGNDLAATGLDMTGAMAVMNVGSFKTWPRLVTGHTAGSDNFTYNTAGSYRDKHQYYYLECKLNLLDAEREWFFDSVTKELYLWVPGGGAPAGSIRGKVQTYAFNVGSCDGTIIDGIDFFGTTFVFNNCNNTVVQNCDLQAPGWSKRMLGSEAEMELTTLWNGTGNTVRNCSFENVDGTALHMKGTACVVDNNEFRNIDFSCAGLPGLGVTIRVVGDGGIIRRNSIAMTGASSAISPGTTAITEFNRITQTGFLQSDGSTIHRTVGEAPDSVSRYNWLHNTVKYTLRFDGDPGGQYGLNHHNVVWDANTMRFKGDFHQTYNNLGFDPRDSDKGNINIATDKGGNANAITVNNAAAIISPATLLDPGDPLPGMASNNWDGVITGTDIRLQLRDADNMDFRPRADSDLVDAGAVISGITDAYSGSAPDIGAYEYDDSNYWIPGRKLAQASTPIPPNQATQVKADADLMWLEGYESATNVVYVGSSPSNLVFQGVQTNNIFSPGLLAAGTDYFWRVDSMGDAGTVTGEVWSFSVAGSGIPASGLTYSEHTNAPLDGAVASFLAISNVWNSITVANNDGIGVEEMYGQTFKAAVDFQLSAVSFHATSDTKTYGTNQVLELVLLEDTNADEVPDTLVGDILSVGFPAIDGARPWKKLKLLNPISMEGGKTYGFAYTLIGPVTDNLRVANSKTGGYADGKAINTDYNAGDFPNPLPPALNSSRDIAFTIQAASPSEMYAAWAGGYAISGNPGHAGDPDGDGLDNLAEYALGGAPDDFDDAPYPTFEDLEYVYRRRTDAVERGLTYTLEESSNLVSNDWNIMTIPPAGIAPLEPGFEAVTNQIPVSASNLFIRLRISLD